MTWLTKYRWRNYCRNSMWLMPTLAIPVALIVVPLTRWLDGLLGCAFIGYTIEGARGLLGAIAPAALMLIGVILSALLVTVQQAASQLTPRLMRGVLARTPIRVCLFILVFSYIYCVGTLGRTETSVPQLMVVVAVLATITSVAAGLYLVDYVARALRPIHMLAYTAGAGRHVISEVYPQLCDAPESPAGPARLPLDSDVIIHSETRSGVLQAIDVKGLASTAHTCDCVIEIIPQVGDFVARGDPLFRVSSDVDPSAVQSLRSSCALGDGRTIEQDPAYVFRILVDVAVRALSPGTNDPTTAVLAIDQIHHLLRQVGLRRLDTGQVHDSAGELRLIYRTPNWEDFVLLAVTEIRQYGAGSIQVMRRLRAMLSNLQQSLPPHRRAVLIEQSSQLDRSVKAAFRDPEDRAQAATADYHGVGGARIHEGSDART